MLQKLGFFFSLTSHEKKMTREGYFGPKMLKTDRMLPVSKFTKLCLIKIILKSIVKIPILM